jgi:hypothetical protein
MAKVIKKNLLFDFILIIITGGIWNLWMQFRKIRDYNTQLGFKKYSFLKWLILTILTFGLYHLYHEYKLTRDMDNGLEIGIMSAAVSATGAWIFVDLYQQSILNGLKK